MVVLVDFVVFVAADVVAVAIMQPACCALATRPCRRCHRVTQLACRVLLYKAISPLPSCDATSLSCACAQGHIVVPIVRRDQHVVRKCTRPYCCPHCVTQPACRAPAHKALLSSPVWRCDVRGFVVDFVNFVAVIVDIIAVLWRNVRGFVVNLVNFVAVIDVVITIARIDVNMLCPCARGLVVRHSSFVVADSCCRCCHCVMRYENAVCLRTRPRRQHLSSLLPLLLSSPLRDTM